MIDCHSHLADSAFTEDIDKVIERAKQANVAGIVVVAEFPGDFDRVIRLHHKYPGYIHPCLGIHPIQCEHESVNAQIHLQGVEERIRKELNWLVGIGEVGLDFSPRFLKNGDDDKRNQREVFKKQIELAKELDLALNVHSRSAGRPTIDFLKENGAKKVLLHAFNGNIKSARGGVESGYFFSIPPSFTLSEEAKAFVKSIPIGTAVFGNRLASFRFKNERHSDFKIICQNGKENKEIEVHKLVLSARSPVFSAMLESHTEEAQSGQVVYDDIDFDVMVDMLFFCYSGRSNSLQSMALDLLVVADRFQLIGLKNIGRPNSLNFQKLFY